MGTRPLAGTAYLAETLLFDVDQLGGRVATIPLQPAQLADGAVSLRDEVGTSKVTGQEERYSHLDLIDIEANVAGAREALDLLAPALTDGEHAALVALAVTRFAAVNAALDRYRTGTGPTDFVTYSAVPDSGRRTISRNVDALGATLSQLPPLVS